MGGLVLGDYASALASVDRVDCLITDTPYSGRVHSGHDLQTAHLDGCPSGDGADRRALGYAGWGPDDVARFVDDWYRRVSGWFVTITDHVLALSWELSLRGVGRYVFAPIPIVIPGSRVRLAGDGPSCWSYWLIVSRPRTKGFSTWGTLPGAYIGKPERNMARVGGKPLWLMRALVRDYSRPGDLVCDPCAGAGTTLKAAIMEGRRVVGAEIDPEAFAAAQRELEKPVQQSLPGVDG